MGNLEGACRPPGHQAGDKGRKTNRVSDNIAVHSNKANGPGGPTAGMPIAAPAIPRLGRRLFLSSQGIRRQVTAVNAPARRQRPHRQADPG